MKNYNYRKLGLKKLKLLVNPFAIEDLDTGKKYTYNSKNELDDALDAYKSSFECDIDDSDFKTQINS